MDFGFQWKKEQTIEDAMQVREVMREQNDFRWGRSAEDIVWRKTTMLGEALP